ncbi:hypothetical protein KI387_024839, partial [Taxus chinensis]
MREGEESEYPVYVLTSKSGDLSKVPNDAAMLAFDPLFTTIDSSILPSNTGPYLLLNYLDVWDLAVVANRRNIDDHIVLLGWILANGKKVAMNIEIVDDKWIPRIELQENDNENLVVGMAMDRTSVDFQISIPTDDGGIRKLPPCPVLLCTTIEGKMNLFSLAKIAEVWHVPELMVAPMAVPTNHALVATVKEKSKFENPIASNFDSKMPLARENVKRPSGISEIEVDFSREIEKVRSMAKEVDDLMLTIEGKKMVSKGNSVLFSKQAVSSIEKKIKKISENCNEFKERLEEQIFYIQNLRDKTMQVDAWRIYMQSIIKQATDQQYQHLRSHQKLNPELDIVRQSISKAEQRLKQKILELEGHLQNLEISKFEVSDGPKRAHQKQFQNT